MIQGVCNLGPDRQEEERMRCERAMDEIEGQLKKEGISDEEKTRLQQRLEQLRQELERIINGMQPYF